MVLYKMWQHLYLTFSALFFAAAIAIPLGFVLSRMKSRRIPIIVIRAAALVQTVPGLAMIALIVVALAALQPYIDLPTTGVMPAICVLTVYALLPMLTSTYTGIKQVNPALIDIAKGIGMRSRQILFFVEFPNALPVIMSGVRISAVWTIGMATLTSLIGSGGLGDLIMQGLRSMQLNLILAGTVPAGCLAILFEWGLSRVERWLIGPCR
jgi:osmoprotectant transport system permease protein